MHLTRKPIRSVRLKVTRDGQLMVSAPPQVSLTQLAAFIASKEDWISSQQRRRQQEAADQDRLVDGGALKLWGQWLPVHRRIGRAGVQSDSESRIIISAHDDLGAERAVRSWRADQVAERAPQYVMRWAPVIGIFPTLIRTRWMTSRWGSCNFKTGVITLNTQLSRYPETALEYVVVHELVHLVHPDHSGQFWDLVARILPDHVNRSAVLRV